MIYLLIGFINTAIGFYACKLFYISCNKEKERLIRVEAFSLGRKHGIRLATMMATEAMGKLKKYVTVDKPYYSPKHNGDIVNINFIVYRKQN